MNEKLTSDERSFLEWLGDKVAANPEARQAALEEYRELQARPKVRREPLRNPDTAQINDILKANGLEPTRHNRRRFKRQATKSWRQLQRAVS